MSSLLRPAAVPKERELSSWKEIAAYLDVSIRTAQLWETERGLPVRRLAGPRGRVSTTTAELQAWKERAATSIPAALSLIQDEDYLPGVVDSPAYRPLATALRQVFRALGMRGLLVGTVAAAVLAVGLYVMVFHAGLPATFRIERDTLVVLDDKGGELWRKPFSPGLDPARYTPEQCAIDRPVWIGDLDGSGRPGVLFAYTPPIGTGESDRLVYFDSRGRERWRFQAGRTVRTATETFAAPFGIRRFLVQGSGRDTVILVSAQHKLYYPNQIAALSPADGRILREYWHSGGLGDMSLESWGPGGRARLYLAGVSNSHHAATLLVLDPDHLSGASREDDSRYQLLGFAPAAEEARILFPRSCLNRDEPYSFVTRFFTRAEGITLAIDQRIPAGASIYYHLNRDLSLREVVPGNDFVSQHAHAFTAGVLAHRFNDGEAAALRALERLR